MGVSTDGIIAFGVDLGEDGVGVLAEIELDEYLALRAGHEDPYDEVATPALNLPREEYEIWKNTTPEGRAFEQQVTDWYVIRRQLREAAPVEIVRHCSGECAMYILALSGTVTTARRGYPETIDLSKFLVPDERIAEAAAFCQDNDLAAFEEPRWLLASLWW